VSTLAATVEPPSPPVAGPATTGPALPPLELVKGADLLSTLPEVNEAAVAAISNTAAPVTSPASPQPGASQPAITDKGGRAFDAKIFRTKPDGSPFVNGNGYFMPRGGRKPSAATTPTATGSSVPADLPGLGGPAVPTPAPAGTAAVAAKETAPAVTPAQHATQADAVIRGACALGNLVSKSDEWKADPEEHNALRDSYVAWAQTRPGSMLPPLALFLVNAFVFVLSRIFKPKTSDRLCRWFPKLRGVLTDEKPPAKTDPAKEEPKFAEPVRPAATAAPAVKPENWAL